MSNLRTVTLPADLAGQLLSLVDEVHDELDGRSTVPSSLTLGESFKRLRMCESVHAQLWNGVGDGAAEPTPQPVEAGTLLHPSEVG